MGVSLELNTRYHERQKEKNHHQEKKPESPKSNSPHHQKSSSSSHEENNFHSQKRDKPHSSLLNKDFKLKHSEKERTKEGLWKSLSEDHVVFNVLHCFPCREQLCILNTGLKNSLKFFVFSSTSDVFYSILIDFGPTHSFIAKQLVHKYSLTTSELPEKISLIILDSSEPPFLFVTHHTEYMDYRDPSNSFHTASSSAKSCAALVGDSQTPSLPSSVHIPSVNLHQSLLLSVAEGFKEIQDFGEDNSVSSCHLFFGNMDLPPSSYHDSLKELWEEEEEPEEVETVMKVVPSVSHQYLYVFSKFKAEKRPPHHTRDHHIELEGCLPPVGVIYSLSKQESDTLRAYISENVEKGFIRYCLFSESGQ
ncbi:hypothetical protein O181_110412 [Austropuccinia psidii MF-1]|uniref:Uncharacterized protein n=1 Tax=Austropuccinia psidii MF-1 TaxID=1389203 RepID=A0A9Q3PSC3_9BASI|nr:hypothetical protein [Austropuccinia psidii MF-1]